MDTHVANGPISNSYHCSSESAEINIDNIVTAVAKLNVRILRLREEIVAFKNENMVSSVLTHNSLSLTPAGFNQPTKNEENRTGARYEPRGNFKGDDSPSGTDLSARLSFAKRAREVKAANEVAVFKEDHPRDDKSIEDDERPNRSRVPEPSRTYRKSILDGEKSGKETDERSENVRDTGNAKTLLIANEKFNERQNEVVSKTDCSPANVFTPKIKRKRISRGVQCVSCRRHAGQSLFNCFKSNSRRHSLVRKVKRKKALADKVDVGLQNDVNSSANIIRDESRNVIKEEIRSTCDTDTKKEELEIDEKKIGRITYRNSKELLVQMQNVPDEKSKGDDESKYRKVKINLLEKLRLRRDLTRGKNDSKTQQNGRGSRNHKEEMAGLSYEDKRVSGKDNSQDIKIVDRQMDSSNERQSIASASVDRRSDVNKIKARLDSCIAELNGIISDACAIFDNRRNGRGC